MDIQRTLQESSTPSSCHQLATMTCRYTYWSIYLDTYMFVRSRSAVLNTAALILQRLFIDADPVPPTCDDAIQIHTFLYISTHIYLHTYIQQTQTHMCVCKFVANISRYIHVSKEHGRGAGYWSGSSSMLTLCHQLATIRLPGRAGGRPQLLRCS